MTVEIKLINGKVDLLKDVEKNRTYTGTPIYHLFR